MRYLSSYYTDPGKRKGPNQDSMLVERMEYGGQEVLLAAVCDGIGGLSKGEVASAEVIRSLADWFRTEFVLLAGQEEFEDALYDSWEILLRDVHRRLRDYGRLHGIRIGTTLTTMLLWQEKYYIAHVGDTRIYKIRDQVTQLTGDQILAQLDHACDHSNSKKIDCGEAEQEKTGSAGKESKAGKNILLQGIGCSSAIRPAYYSGEAESNTVYLLCTDGFRRKLGKEELRKAFAPEALINEEIMAEQGRATARLVMERGERDNITVIMLRTAPV